MRENLEEADEVEADRPLGKQIETGERPSLRVVQGIVRVEVMEIEPRVRALVVSQSITSRETSIPV